MKDVEVAGRRYVVCRNDDEARKDAETRTALIAGLERKLAQGDKALVANAGYRRFLDLIDDRRHRVDRKGQRCYRS